MAVLKLPWGKKKQPGRRPSLMAGQDEYVFRRSRTLTGSTSSKVNSGAEKRGQLKTERLKLHELRAHRRYILRLLAGVLGLVALVGFLLVNFILTPPFIVWQKGKSQAHTTSYQETLYKYFGDRPLERFGFMLKPADVAAELKRNHTEIGLVEVRRAWYGGDAQFVITFRDPLIVWKTGDRQFYVDAQGVAFSYNHFKAPKVAVTDKSGIAPGQSGMVASTRFIRFLGQMVGAVNQYKKGMVTTVIIPQSTRQINLKLQGRDYIIKTQIDRDPLQQAEDIANTLSFLDRKGITPKYIDVRVPHKAFYR